jgi:hypothetical protein
MKKFAIVFVVLALALVFASNLIKGSKTRAAGPTCSVPGDYTTIQAAVNDAGCTTINVAAGTYNETVTIGRSVIVKGAQNGNNDFITRGASPAAESTVNGTNLTAGVATFTINAVGVIIDGFTVKHTVTSGAAIGLTISGAGHGAGIYNNIFDTITTPDTTSQGTAQAIYLTSGGADNVKIQNNEMKNISSNRSAKGVLVGDNGGTNPSFNLHVENNSIHDVTSTTRGAYGVSVANVTGILGLQITDNTISYLFSGGWIHAIGLEGDTPGSNVTGNSISNLSATGLDVSAVFFEVNPSFGTVQVHNNNFNLPSTQFGIAVHPTLSAAFPTVSVPGTCNWWNSPTGPTAGSNPGGTGAGVGPNVSYKPWLNTPAPGAVCGSIATNKNQCKDGGWMTLFRADGSTFKNQGDCIQYANTGK